MSGGQTRQEPSTGQGLPSSCHFIPPIQVHKKILFKEGDNDNKKKETASAVGAIREISHPESSGLMYFVPNNMHVVASYRHSVVQSSITSL